MSTHCLVCREVAGEIELPGGLTLGKRRCDRVSHAPDRRESAPYLGHCMV